MTLAERHDLWVKQGKIVHPADGGGLEDDADFWNDSDWTDGLGLAEEAFLDEVHVKPYVRDGHPVAGYVRHEERMKNFASVLNNMDRITKADVEAGHVPGVRLGGLAEGVAGHAGTDAITISPSGFNADGEINSFLLAHEIGHYLVPRVIENGVIPPELEALSAGRGRAEGRYGAVAGNSSRLFGPNRSLPEEFIADSYADLIHGRAEFRYVPGLDGPDDPDEREKARREFESYPMTKWLHVLAKIAGQQGLPDHGLWRFERDSDGEYRIVRLGEDDWIVGLGEAELLFVDPNFESLHPRQHGRFSKKFKIGPGVVRSSGTHPEATHVTHVFREATPEERSTAKIPPARDEYLVVETSEEDDSPGDIALVGSEIALADVSIRGYTRKDGTVVRPHVRHQLTHKTYKTLLRLLREQEGFSYQPYKGTEPVTGYMVSIHPEYEIKKPVDEITEEDLSQYVHEHWDVWKDNPDLYFGAWIAETSSVTDPVTGRVYPGEVKVFLDVSSRIDDKAEAERLARWNAQLAVWDLDSMTPIQTLTEEEAARGERISRVQGLRAAEADQGHPAEGGLHGPGDDGEGSLRGDSGGGSEVQGEEVRFVDTEFEGLHPRGRHGQFVDKLLSLDIDMKPLLEEAGVTEEYQDYVLNDKGFKDWKTGKVSYHSGHDFPSTLVTGLRVWRSGFQYSSNMRRYLEGRNLTPAFEDDHMFKAEALSIREGLKRASPVEIPTYRSTWQQFDVGDEIQMAADSVAFDRYEAEGYTFDDVGIGQATSDKGYLPTMLVFPPETRGIRYDRIGLLRSGEKKKDTTMHDYESREAIIQGRFRVVSEEIVDQVPPMSYRSGLRPKDQKYRLLRLERIGNYWDDPGEQLRLGEIRIQSYMRRGRRVSEYTRHIPEVLYHYTTDAGAEGIHREGFKLGQKGGLGPLYFGDGVYLAVDQDQGRWIYQRHNMEFPHELPVTVDVTNPLVVDLTRFTASEIDTGNDNHYAGLVRHMVRVMNEDDPGKGDRFLDVLLGLESQIEGINKDISKRYPFHEEYRPGKRRTVGDAWYVIRSMKLLRGKLPKDVQRQTIGAAVKRFVLAEGHDSFLLIDEKRRGYPGGSQLVVYDPSKVHTASSVGMDVGLAEVRVKSHLREGHPVRSHIRHTKHPKTLVDYSENDTRDSLAQEYDADVVATGNCGQYGFDRLFELRQMGDRKAVLYHGLIDVGQASGALPPGLMYSWHAWVKRGDGMIEDWQGEVAKLHPSPMNEKDFLENMAVQDEPRHVYTVDEAMEWAYKSMNYGPWEHDLIMRLSEQPVYADVLWDGTKLIVTEMPSPELQAVLLKYGVPWVVRPDGRSLGLSEWEERLHPRGRGGKFAKKALEAYVGPHGYKDINRTLRGTVDNKVDEFGYDQTPLTKAEKAVAEQSIADIDEAFHEAEPLKKAITVFRGRPDSFGDIKVGDEISDPAFMSTSAEPYFGELYTDSSDPSPGDLLVITVPAGFKAIHVSDIVPDEEWRKEEKEVLLPRGVMLKVKKLSIVELEDGKPYRRIEAEVAGQRSLGLSEIKGQRRLFSKRIWDELKVKRDEEGRFADLPGSHRPDDWKPEMTFDEAIEWGKRGRFHFPGWHVSTRKGIEGIRARGLDWRKHKKEKFGRNFGSGNYISMKTSDSDWFLSGTEWGTGRGLDRTAMMVRVENPLMVDVPPGSIDFMDPKTDFVTIVSRQMIGVEPTFREQVAAMADKIAQEYDGRDGDRPGTDFIKGEAIRRVVQELGYDSIGIRSDGYRDNAIGGPQVITFYPWQQVAVSDPPSSFIVETHRREGHVGLSEDDIELADWTPEDERLHPRGHGGKFRRTFHIDVPSLEGRDWNAETGNSDHLSRTERGMIPLAAIAHLRGVKEEAPGEHRNRQGPAWDSFVNDIRENGIRDPIFITVDYNDEPKISEGNHRRDAAIEAGLTEVPVEIRYFGNAQGQGTVLERSIETGGEDGARARAALEGRNFDGPRRWEINATLQLLADQANVVIEDIVGRKTRWNGDIKMNTALANGGLKDWGCWIELGEKYADIDSSIKLREDLTAGEREFVRLHVIIHELTHAISNTHPTWEEFKEWKSRSENRFKSTELAKPTYTADGPPEGVPPDEIAIARALFAETREWEEGLVEMFTRSHYDEIRARMEGDLVPRGDSKRVEKMWEKQHSYSKWVRYFHAQAQACGMSDADFSRELLAVSALDRPRWLFEKLRARAEAGEIDDQKYIEMCLKKIHETTHMIFRGPTRTDLSLWVRGSGTDWWMETFGVEMKESFYTWVGGVNGKRGHKVDYDIASGVPGFDSLWWSPERRRERAEKKAA